MIILFSHTARSVGPPERAGTRLFFWLLSGLGWSADLDRLSGPEHDFSSWVLSGLGWSADLGRLSGPEHDYSSCTHNAEGWTA